MKSLSKIGREMAALPELKEDAMDVDEPADAAAPGSGVATPSVEKPAPAQGGGGKKKKKGKK